VALQNKELLKEKKLKIIENILNQAVDEARFLGIEKKELKQMLDLLYEESEE